MIPPPNLPLPGLSKGLGFRLWFMEFEGFRFYTHCYGAKALNGFFGGRGDLSIGNLPARIYVYIYIYIYVYI